MGTTLSSKILFFPFFLNVEFSISAFPWKTSQSCWVSTYSSPPPKVYWQVASNIFPKARIKPFVNPFLPSSHKNSNRNSHPTPSWKLRESASETSSDHGTNRKRQYGVTVWQKKPHLTWQWRQAMTQLSQILQEVCEHAQLNTAGHPRQQSQVWQLTRKQELPFKTSYHKCHNSKHRKFLNNSKVDFFVCLL